MRGRVPALVNPDLKPFLNLHVNLHADPSCALPIGARCSDDLAAAHYRLAHAVPMVGLRPTTEPNHIFYWDHNRLIARSGWSHALGGKTESDQIEYLLNLQMNLQMSFQMNLQLYLHVKKKGLLSFT